MAPVGLAQMSTMECRGGARGARACAARMRGRGGRPGRLDHDRGVGPAGRPRPGAGQHSQRVGADVARVHATAHVQAPRRTGRDRADSRARRGPPGDLGGRPDLPPAPEGGARLLGRHAGEGVRLRADRQAAARSRVCGHRVLRRCAGRRRLREDGRSGRGHRRDRDGRRVPIHRDRPRRSRQHLLERAGHDLLRRGPRRHAVPEHDEDSTARRGAVPDRSYDRPTAASCWSA